jgi:hypothetical protein
MYPFVCESLGDEWDLFQMGKGCPRSDSFPVGEPFPNSQQNSSMTCT